MAVKPVRIGIIGAGGIVRTRHMPGLAEIDGVQVLAVCNRHEESTRRFAADFDIPRTCRKWQDVVAMDDIDVIWIGTTPYMHCPITLAALDAGKHVFCQARMCMNLDEARRMVAAADAHPELVTMICPPPHGMVGDRVMRRLLHEERFCGDLRHVHLRNLAGNLLDPHAELHWRLDKQQSGLNAFALGIYVEVLNRWIGPARRVAALTKIWTHQRRHPETGQLAPVQIPESINIVAELANGALGVYELNGVSAHAPPDSLELYGTAGTLVYRFGGDESIEGARVGQERLKPIPIPPDERREWTVEADFIHAVRTGDKSRIEPDFHDGLAYMEFIEAVYRSAESGRAVELPL